ncbi:MAG: hypothetical protein WC742_07870 [Gallionellaceae bacterium]
MGNNILKSKYRNILFLLVLLFIPAGVYAAPLEDVSLQQYGDEVHATIKFTTPVHFLRYFPDRKARIVEIFYERLPSSDATEPWANLEVRSSPATALTPAFTVTTRDQTLQPKLVVEFAREVTFALRAGGDNRSFVLIIKPEHTDDAVINLPLPLLPDVLPPVADGSVPTVEAVPGADSAAAVPPDNNQQGYALMRAGRTALADKDYPAATDAFNKLLMLPPNQYSQDAQEWVGVARERGGQLAKAKAEYELYLKLYSTGPGVQWVKQRLASLATPAAAAKAPVKVRKIEDRSFAQGGISSRYYYGQSKLETTYNFNNALQTDSYNLTDQSMLVTNVDATQRFISENFDNRIVFRDVLTQNFLPKGKDKNRINAAYFEVKNRPNEYSARMGRQTTGGGGVMGRFDGVSAGYGSPQNFRLNGVAGQLVEFTDAPQPIFYGLSVDAGPVSVYFINQTIEGVLDRRAVGTEFKYFNNGQSAFALLDYDIFYKELNAAMLTGTLAVEMTGTSVNFMADYRRSPAMSTRNALNGAMTTKVADLLAIMSEADVQKLARSRTGTAAFAQLGITQKLSTHYQVGGDIRLSKTSGLGTSGVAPDATTGAYSLQGYIPAYAATGLDKTVSAQFMASNIYSVADITSLGGSVNSSDYVKSGQSVFLYNRTSAGRDLAIDTSWNYYQQTDTYGGKMARHMPMLRVTYQIKQAFSLDADAGLELSTSSGPYQSSKTTRTFGSAGLRWDF